MDLEKNGPNYQYGIELEKLIVDIDQLVSNKNHHINGVVYGNLCKLAAELCFNIGMHLEGIYYLSESHGATLREECCYHHDAFGIRREYNGIEQSPGLQKKYISFYSSYAESKTEGLLQRLKEIPKEWTLIQLTQSLNTDDHCHPRPANSIPRMTDLHIVRYSGGNLLQPCHLLIPTPKTADDGTVSVLQLMYDFVRDKSLHMRPEPVKVIKNKRKENCQVVKSVVTEVITSWLKEWSCMLLGRICDEKLERSIKESIDDIFDRSTASITFYERTIIYQVASGCVHLSEDEIESAVYEIISDTSLQNLLVEKILYLRTNNKNLASEKRYPVILLLDEKLECIPWEMIAVLKQHPVSRLPSIHFVHALFKEHESTIVNGNKIVSNPSSGFYIINPDLSLQNTEKRIINFLNLRFPKWQGLVGKTPSKYEFMDALKDYNIFLYCGHGNGTQYLNSYDIREMRVKAIPLLFGCSSVKAKDLGGRTPFVSLSYSYLISASPCVLGMLWSVTNTDTDYMSLTLLNHWLPGKPINLKDIEGFSHQPNASNDMTYQEPELLRVLNVARDSATLYTNSAALVVYGIPIKVESS